MLVMCESAVYMLKGSEKILVMEETARIIVAGKDVVCIDSLGERKTIPDAKISEANLVKHEVLVKPF
jgi:predicted RNA-binding protein